MSLFGGRKPVAIFHIAAVAFLLAALPSHAMAAGVSDCSTTPGCTYVAIGQALNVTPSAFTASPSCKQITNHSCPAPILVPMENQNEWASFNTNHESCATLSDCDTYAWITSGWGTCSETCGGGTQTQTVSCQQTDPDTGVIMIVDDSFCPVATMPETSQNCNPDACNGQCGYESGMTLSSTPSAGAGLCSQGTATGMVYTGTSWNWSCDAAASNASCSTSYAAGGMPSCAINRTPTQTVTTSTTVSSVIQGYLYINGSNLTVTVSGYTIQSCVYANGNSNTINIQSGDQNSITIGGNSNIINIGVVGGQDQDTISVGGNNITLTENAGQNGTTVTGASPHVNFTSPVQNYTAIYGANAVVTSSGGDQSSFYIYGNDAVYTTSGGENGASITGDYGVITTSGGMNGSSITGNYGTITMNGGTTAASSTITGNNGTITMNGSGTSDYLGITGNYGTLTIGSGSIATGASIVGNNGTATINDYGISSSANITGTSAKIIINGSNGINVGGSINGSGTINNNGTVTNVP